MKSTCWPKTSDTAIIIPVINAMRHRKRGRKLSRTSAHRKAMRRNIAKALFEHERIITTPAKAKETKPFAEKLITLARKAQPYKNAAGADERAKYVHYYRLALKKLQDKHLVQKLFGEGRWRDEGSLAERFADRPSGQTRILKISGSRLGTPFGYTVSGISEMNYEIGGRERKLKLTGNRLGDNAQQVIFELVRPHEEQLRDEAVEPEIEMPDETAPDAPGTDEEEVKAVAEEPGGENGQEDENA